MSPRHEQYAALKQQVDSQAPRFQVEGILHFTKSAPGFYRQQLERDFGLEEELKTWIAGRASFEQLASRMIPYNTEGHALHWPAHVPVKMLGFEGSFGDWENVFLFFPHALGFLPEKPDDIFGFELVQVSEAIFANAILPCLTQAFYPYESLTELCCSHATIRRSVYLYAIFHEMAHLVGPWRVSPRIAPLLKVTEYQQGALSELSADLLAFKAAGREFPEMVLTTFLMRIFWYLRRDKKRNDVDGWIGAYWWNLAMRGGALIPSLEGKFELDVPRLLTVFEAALEEVLLFGHATLALPAEAQSAHAAAWMESQVSGPHESYRIAPELENIFSQCQSIPTWLGSLGQA